MAERLLTALFIALYVLGLALLTAYVVAAWKEVL